MRAAIDPGVTATPVAKPDEAATRGASREAPGRRARSKPSRFLPRMLLAPAVATLFLWMIVPLVMTIYFSFIRYNLLQPDQHGFIGLMNYEFFVTDPSFWPAVTNTLVLIGSVIAITVVLGIALASAHRRALPRDAAWCACC